MKKSIEYILSQKKKGKDHSAIYKELEEEDIDSLEIRKLMREADGIFLDSLLEKKETIQLVSNKTKGTWLIFLGIVVTVVSLLYAFEFGGGFYIILFGPIISGGGLLSNKSKRNDSFFKSPFSNWKEKKY